MNQEKQIKDKKLPLELIVFAYFLVWIPYIALTRGLTNTPHGNMTRPLKGLEFIPVSLTLVLVFIYLFFTVSGWWKFAHHRVIFGISVPCPTKWTLLSAVGSSMLLVTVPLSYTFAGVSIPFIQLLMRGDVLLIAPIVDVVSGRKVRWYSWVALAMVAVALIITIWDRGGFFLPPLCIVAIVIYTIGYFLRLGIMTKIAKTPDPSTMKRYFVEEQMVTYLLAILVLGLLALIGQFDALLEIRWGFVEVWQSGAVWWIVPVGLFTAILAVYAAQILLDERENTFCVPIERSASILGGIAATYLLATIYGTPPPTNAELVGAVILIAAIALLSLAPRFSRPKPMSLATKG